jgi:hypothetical protein
MSVAFAAMYLCHFKCRVLRRSEDDAIEELRAFSRGRRRFRLVNLFLQASFDWCYHS